MRLRIALLIIILVLPVNSTRAEERYHELQLLMTLDSRAMMDLMMQLVMR